MKLHRSGSPEKMLQAFQAKLDQLESQGTVQSSTVIAAHFDYFDEHGNAFGEPGMGYQEEDVRKYWDENHDSDPSLEEYDSYESWIDDTVNNGWLKRDHFVESCGNVFGSTSETEIDDRLEEIHGKNQDATVCAAFDPSTIDIARLYEVIDKYNTSLPVSGSWDTETEDEQRLIAKEFGLSLDEAKMVMIELLGFPADDKFVSAATAVTCHYYIDETGNAFGEPGIRYSEDELRRYYEENRDSDPCCQGFETFEDWLTNTVDNLDLKMDYVDGGCHGDIKRKDKKAEVEGSEEISSWVEEATKSVPDADGFYTDYTLYHNVDTDEYVCVFGDKDLYSPEDHVFDAEFESRDEAIEWFDSYTGFADDDDLM